ncbi:MAG: HlyD family efflux transporter periplasmic adaptor subunit [Oscillospiraceae bacterium]|jgi:multidrug efflux pump subunit AcrA (membrane-fusion protein)|nr:HlyD family efflux transporter periplasmic adaptor subunit [Oscillospiraceae bacterium]
MEKKKSKKGIVITIVVTVIVLAVIGLYLIGRNSVSMAERMTLPQYSIAEVETGDLAKTVSAMGSLTAEHRDLSTRIPLKILSYPVSVGDTVAAGNPIALVDRTALDETVKNLRQEIAEHDREIQRLNDAHDTTKTFTSPYSGRIKEIHCEIGDDASSLGTAFVLSADGKMKLETKLTEKHDLNTLLTVKADGKSYSGTVVSLDSDGIYKLTVTDNGPESGAAATVHNSNGDQIGSGELDYNNPLTIKSDPGIITKIHVSENDKVYKGTNLLNLKQIPLSDAYAYEVNTRQNKLDDLDYCLNIQKKGYAVVLEDDVTVKSVGEENQTVPPETPFASVYTVGATELNIQVDELDIASVEAGQKATVILDALPSEKFEGTVTKISNVGNSEAGVTTFDVTVVIEANSSCKIGMNGNASIIAQQHKNVPVIPINALQHEKDEQYVWISRSGVLPEDRRADPGEKVVVTTGLSDAEKVEITSGLNPGDKIVVVTRPQLPFDMMAMYGG